MCSQWDHGTIKMRYCLSKLMACNYRGLCHITYLRCSTWPKIDLHLNVIICTHWLASVENIHISFHFIETDLNYATCLFSWKFLRALLHSLTMVKVVILLLCNIVWCTVNHIYWWYIVMGSFSHSLQTGPSRAIDNHEDSNIMRAVIQNLYLKAHLHNSRHWSTLSLDKNVDCQCDHIRVDKLFNKITCIRGELIGALENR